MIKHLFFQIFIFTGILKTHKIFQLIFVYIVSWKKKKKKMLQLLSLCSSFLRGLEEGGNC